MKVVKVAAAVILCALFLTACGYEYTKKWVPSSLVGTMITQMENDGWELVSQKELPNSEPSNCCPSTGPYHELVFRKHRALVDTDN
jgi:hypothetical protein